MQRRRVERASRLAPRPLPGVAPVAPSPSGIDDSPLSVESEARRRRPADAPPLSTWRRLFLGTGARHGRRTSALCDEAIVRSLDEARCRSALPPTRGEGPPRLAAGGIDQSKARSRTTPERYAEGDARNEPVHRGVVDRCNDQEDRPDPPDEARRNPKGWRQSDRHVEGEDNERQQEDFLGLLATKSRDLRTRRPTGLDRGDLCKASSACQESSGLAAMMGFRSIR
jgi:hypothetical protein